MVVVQRPAGVEVGQVGQGGSVVDRPSLLHHRPIKPSDDVGAQGHQAAGDAAVEEDAVRWGAGDGLRSMSAPVEPSDATLVATVGKVADIVATNRVGDSVLLSSRWGMFSGTPSTPRSSTL